MDTRSNTNATRLLNRIFVNSLFFFAIFPTVLLGQVETTTRITGLVTDSSRAAVAGVVLTLRNQETGATRQAASDAGGAYSFPSLPPGIYTITATSSGFKTAVVTDRLVQVAQPAKVDIVLEVGELAQSVTVSAAGAELLTTSSTEVSETLNPRLVASLPTQRDNMFDLAALTPGASPQDLKLGGASFVGASLNFVSATNDFTSSGLVLHGQRDSGTNVSVDGANVQSSVYQQTTQLQASAGIQEMRVQSGNMNAEFGGGVAAVNVVTKNGTNQYHGELYETFRNNSLDANMFFNNLLNRKLPAYKTNLFGLAAGGPIKKNKLLFFGNYQGTRVRQTSVTTQTVPPLSVRDGDFSQMPGSPTIYNPYEYDAATGLRKPFPGNKIPSAYLDPVTLAFMQKWVAAPNTLLNNLATYAGESRAVIDSDQGSLRVDFLKSSNTTIYGRWTRLQAWQASTGPQALQATTNPYGSENEVAHWTQIIGARAVNDVMVASTRPTWTYGRDKSHGNVARDIGLKNVGDVPGAPSFSVSGYSMDTPTLYDYWARENNYQLKDDFTISKGRHNIKLGAELRERRFYYTQNSSDQGLISFGSTFGAACPAGKTACTNAMRDAGLSSGGNGLADFFLGATTSASLNLYPSPYAGYQRYYGPYVQDSWRATSKLTVNFGLRYEYWRPWRVPRNTVGRWNMVTGQWEYALKNPLDYLSAAACYGRCGALTPGIPREIYTTGNHNFAPRLGLAYQIDKATVFRAGVGIFYDGNPNNNQMVQMTSRLAPFNLSLVASALASDQVPTLLVKNLFPPPSPTGVPQPYQNPPATGNPVLPYLPTPTVYQWSGSLQRSIGSYWAVELDYVGSHTIHQSQLMDLNSARLPQGPDAALSIQNRRRFPAWGSMQSWTRAGWAGYNAGAFAIRNRSWHGLTLISNFTWAKNLTTTDIRASDTGSPSFYAPYILYGDSAITARLRFVAAFSYELPFGRGKTFSVSRNPIVQVLVGGWKASGVATFSTGSPQRVLAANDLTGVLLGAAYPNRICDPSNVPGGRSRSTWINTACFTDAPYGTWPNSPIGAATIPGINNWNWTFDKAFPVHFPNEAGRITFRVDLLNAFNHTQWGTPALTYGSAGFGSISATRPARRVTLALRYEF